MKVKIVVFIKAPKPGFVKTRLAVSMGNQEACRAYELLAHHFLNQLSACQNVELRFTPDNAVDAMTPFLKSSHWTMKPQGEGNLGERMARAMHQALDEADAVLIFGTDCPYVESYDVETAIEALLSSEVVIGPAADGGYWMIGFRNAEPKIFTNISWSTDQVLGQTYDTIKKLGLNCFQLRTLEDVDDLESWERAAAMLVR